MRIVADTGILVRGSAKATGPARELLVQIGAGPHTVILSPFLLEQTRRVLSYPRLQALYELSEQDIELLSTGEWTIVSLSKTAPEWRARREVRAMPGHHFCPPATA
jgi:hypothetical protein